MSYPDLAVDAEIVHTIANVAVVGAGYMGTGILQVLAASGLNCVFSDVDAHTAEAAQAACLRQTDEFEAIGYFTPDDAQAIRNNSGWASSLADAVADADLVIEAVSEDIAVKKHVLAAIEHSVSAGTVLATNTSSIPIADLASELDHPQRLYGMHWFNPAQFLPCVEVVEGPGASPQTTQLLMALLTRARRQPVVVADTPGFVSNRLQFAMFREAALMVEEGLVSPERLDEVVRGSFGFRLPFFGPFAIADMAGLDVYAAVFEVLEKTLGNRFSCPPGLSRLVAQGRLGTKSGAGYGDFDAERVELIKADRDRAYVMMAQTLAAWQKSEPLPS